MARGGTTPGVTVLANGGQPGSGGSILLRGVNSVSQGNSPLIYIDGVRVFSPQGEPIATQSKLVPILLAKFPICQLPE